MTRTVRFTAQAGRLMAAPANGRCANPKSRSAESAPTQRQVEANFRGGTRAVLPKKKERGEKKRAKAGRRRAHASRERSWVAEPSFVRSTNIFKRTHPGPRPNRTRAGVFEESPGAALQPRRISAPAARSSGFFSSNSKITGRRGLFQERFKPGKARGSGTPDVLGMPGRTGRTGHAGA